MNLRFLGGAGEVGRMSLLVETGDSRGLLDYGIQPSDPPQYPTPPPPVDFLVVSHGHLDHCGLAPLMAADGVPVLATPCTHAIAPILCRDAIKVHQRRGYGQPYHEREVEELVRNGQLLHTGRQGRTGDVRLELHPAGHIPGAALTLVDDKVLYTGDLNTIATRLVSGARPVSADTLVMESTYGGREHPDRAAEERRFIETVDAVTESGGVALVPAFATGRTQEALLILHDAGYDPVVDGLGVAMTEAMLEHPGAVRDAGRLRHALRRTRRIRHWSDRRRLCEPGAVIVTTGGMLEGGPVLAYLPMIARDPKSAVLLPGFQVEGTNGHRLVTQGQVETDKGLIRVHAKVEKFDLSSHAGHSQLVEFARMVSPERIVLCHGENAEPLVRDLASIATVLTPSNGELLAV